MIEAFQVNLLDLNSPLTTVNTVKKKEVNQKYLHCLMERIMHCWTTYVIYHDFVVLHKDIVVIHRLIYLT